MKEVGKLLAGVAVLAMFAGAAQAAGVARKGIDGLRPLALVQVQADDTGSSDPGAGEDSGDGADGDPGDGGDPADGGDGDPGDDSGDGDPADGDDPVDGGDDGWVDGDPGDDGSGGDDDGIIVIDDGWVEGEEPVLVEDPGVGDDGSGDDEWTDDEEEWTDEDIILELYPYEPDGSCPECDVFIAGEGDATGQPRGWAYNHRGNEVPDTGVAATGADRAPRAVEPREVSRGGSAPPAFCRQMASQGRWQDCNWLWSQRD